MTKSRIIFSQINFQLSTACPGSRFPLSSIHRVPTTGTNQGKRNFVKKNPCREKSGNLEKMGKIRGKSGNFTKTCQGNIREFSAIYVYTDSSPIFQDI